MMLKNIRICFTSLEGEVESQRQQRLSDAKQVEAKAARIKVTMIFIIIFYDGIDDDITHRPDL